MEKTHYYQLKNHIASMRIIQESNIANLAMKNPDNLSNNAQFKSCVVRFKILNDILDRAEQIESGSPA